MLRIIQRNKYRLPHITDSLDSYSQLTKTMDRDEINQSEPVKIVETEERVELMETEEAEMETETIVTEETEETIPAINPEGVNDRPSVSCQCCICGYGAVAPPLSFSLASSPTDNHPVHEVVRNRGRKPNDYRLSQVRLNGLVDSFVTEWDGIVQELITNEETRLFFESKKQSFAEGNRGDFWKCATCNCIVHEQCLDFSDHWMLFKDNQFKCILYFI